MSTPCSRRRALRLLGTAPVTGLAGCVSSPIGDLGEPNAGSGSVDVTFTASVERSFTAEHPGRIRVALSNDGDEPFAMTVTHGIEGPLSVIEGERADGDASLYLLADPPGGDHETPPGAPCDSDAYAIPDERSDGCWRPACEFPRLTAHYAIPVAPGETLSWPYVVLDAFNETCLPSGTCAFEETAPVALEREPAGPRPRTGRPTTCTSG